MTELLLEIGTEEIPAGYIDPALDDLRRECTRRLDEARLSHGAVEVFGTPRRLVLRVAEVAASQPDREEEVTGPRADIAWTPEGALSKAGQGFLRGKGLGESAAYRKQTPKGEVIAAMVREAGRGAEGVLPSLLEGLIAHLSFPKTMRWTDARTSFARPLRWIVALLGNRVLPLRFGDVVAGRTTFGHRFHAPGPIEVPEAHAYAALVERAYVTLAKEERKRCILEGARALAREAGGQLLEDDALLEEVANLVERPWPLLGRFDEKFLAVPKELLLSEMREHQRYFGIVDAQGQLLPAFIVVAGSEPTSRERVAAGNARVLRARFEDGAFYFHEDRKLPMDERAARLQGVIFQRQLGTLADKAGRMESLVGTLCDLLALPADTRTRALRAAHLCKADLVSGVVGEFPELQGTMGRYYAAAEGEPAEVSQAIEEHYAPRHAGAALPTTDEGALVGVADRLDTLVGILGIGKAPTGSADPFALRRAAIAVVRLVLDRGWSFSLSSLVEAAIAALGAKLSVERESLRAQVLEFFRVRLRGVLVERCEEQGLPGANDIVDGVLAVGFDSLPDAEARTIALARVRARDPDAFASVAATFKRVGNILAKARESGAAIAAPEVLREVLREPAELALLDTLGPELDAASSATYEERLTAIAALQPAVARFFDEVLVMAEDAALRAARLGLLQRVSAPLMTMADFTRVQVEGTAA